MIYTISFAGKSTFMRSAKNLRLKKFDNEGNVLSESDYKQPFIPGVGRSYIPKTREGKVLIDMKQEELNKLVQKLELYDKSGKVIETAPINNPNAPFWKHEKMRLFIENAGINLDDDDDFGRLWLAVFKADPTFSVGVQPENPAMDGVVKFKVVHTADALKEKARDIDEVSDATELLHKMEFDKQVKILTAMGVITKNPDPVQVKRRLMERITVDKDKIGPGGERYIELFMRLASVKTSEINIRGLIMKAQESSRRLIIKSKGKYFYGELPLGRSVEEVYQFLTSDDNADILSDIALKAGADDINQ